MQRRARASAGLAAVLLAVAAALLPASPALAHASLIDSSPAHGAQVNEAPDEVRLLFTEPVTVAPGGVVLLDAAGAAVESGPAQVATDAPEQVRLPLPPELADGTYLVSWRVVSADSHPVTGAVVFTVGEAPPQDLPVTDLGGDAWLATVFTAARWAGYAGLTLLAGALLVLSWCWPSGWRHRRTRRLLTTGWVTSVAAAAATLLLQGPYAAGRPLAAIADPAMLAGTWQTDVGRYVSARLGLLVLAGALVSTSSLLSRRVRDTAAVVLAVALAATWVGTGHSNTAGPFEALVNTVHLVAMAAWFGGLALLVVCLLPRTSPVPAGDLTGVLRRFSTLAVGAVVTLLVTGAYLAWRQVGSLAALAGTDYGRLLAFKLAVLGVLLWFGAMSRTVVQRRYLTAGAVAGSPAPDNPQRRSARRAARAAQADQQRVRGQLRQSVRLEVGTAVVVLAISSVLVATPPAATVAGVPAAAADPAAAAQEATLPAGGVVRARLDPGWRGDNRLTVTVLRDGGDEPWDVPEVTASLAPPGDDLGQVPVELTRTGPGGYAAELVPVPMGGTWQLRVTVRTSEIDADTVRFAIPVR